MAWAIIFCVHNAALIIILALLYKCGKNKNTTLDLGVPILSNNAIQV